MLRLIPAGLHRLAYALAHGLRLCWWKVARPTLLGCRVLAFDPAGRVLLVRHSYGKRHWMLPGGGVARRESPIMAAQRELREETGCTLLDPCSIALLNEALHGARNRVHVIGGTTADQPLCDGREVVAAAFFAPDELPGDLSPRLRAGLAEWISTYRRISAERG